MKILLSLLRPVILGTAFFIATVYTCQRLEPLSNLVFNTDFYESLSNGNYKLNGTLINIGNNEITEHGFCWSEQRNPTTSGSSTELGSRDNNGSFSSTISGLSPNTTFYYRAYVTTSSGTKYARERSFVTETGVPTVNTSEAGTVTETTVILGGEVTEDGGATVTEHGVYYGTSTSPQTTGTKVAIGSGTGVFSETITELSNGTEYYFVAYATNSEGTAYGSTMSFTTDQTEGVPVVITSAATSVGETSATIGGEVTDDGGATVTGRGIYYGTSTSPQTTGTKVTIGSGTGTFSNILTGLTNGTVYYFVAYATNSAGTAYGLTLSFTSDQTEGVPTVTTSAATSVGETTATVGGEVTDDGGATVTECGVYYGTSTNPQTTGTKVDIGSGTGTFSSTLSELANGTDYYFVAYASNSAGTAYGATLSFTTDHTEGVPTVTTDEATSVGETSASVGGEVTNDGGATVTERGVYYGTASNPQTTGTKKSIGSGTGTFSTNLTGLLDGITYYFVAYATNSAGTSFGTTRSFTTNTIIVEPTVTTNEATSVGETTATVGGEVTDDGGATVTERGVYYGTLSNPEATGTKMAIGNGTGTFSTNLTGLLDGNTYYFVAYATNSAGTAFGTTKSFTTSIIAVDPTVTTSDAASVGETSATVGGNVTDDGGGTITERGVYYGTSSNPQSTGTKRTIGSGTGPFSTSLTDLSGWSTYYYVAYATNSAGTSYGSEMSFKTLWDNSTNISDYDGNQYGTQQIGDQIWMSEGLMTTHYADGTAIPLVSNSGTWAGLSSTGKAYCWYSNASSWGPIYGALYTWAAAMNGEGSSDTNPSGVQGVCPNGWHLPSDAEWKQIEIHLGMSLSDANDEGYRGTNQGGKMKETGYNYWNEPNTGANNESGFSARPAGIRDHNGDYFDLGNGIGMWTATAYSSTHAWDRALGFDNETIWRFRYQKKYGFSVRCIKDE